MSRSTSGGAAGVWAEPPRSRRSGRAKSRSTSNFRSVSSLPVSSALMRRGYRRAPARRIPQQAAAGARRAEPDAGQPGRADGAVAAGVRGSDRARSGPSALARAARLRGRRPVQARGPYGRTGICRVAIPWLLRVFAMPAHDNGARLAVTLRGHCRVRSPGRSLSAPAWRPCRAASATGPLVPGTSSGGGRPGARDEQRGYAADRGLVALIAEHDDMIDGYEAVQLPPAPRKPGRKNAAMLRRRSPRTTKRAVLYLHCLADSFVPEDLASWYTERGFHFYVADLRPQARLGKPARGRPAAPDVSECLGALDAMSGYLRESEAIDTVVVSAHGAGALVAALWCDARRATSPADALILAGPAFGRGRPHRTLVRLRKRPAGQAASTQRRLRHGLDIACPVLVMCAAAEWDAPEAGRRGKRLTPQPGGHGTIRLGPHVTWLRLDESLTGPLPPDGAGSSPFYRELGRWLGAYLSGQFRDQLL